MSPDLTPASEFDPSAKQSARQTIVEADFFLPDDEGWGKEFVTLQKPGRRKIGRGTSASIRILTQCAVMDHHIAQEVCLPRTGERGRKQRSD
jgi:hypothetical protein